MHMDSLLGLSPRPRGAGRLVTDGSGEPGDPGLQGNPGRGPGDDTTDPLEQPLLAVCCEGADVLALYDLLQGDALGTIPVGSHPVHAMAHESRVFVATMGERSVDIVDTDGTVDRVHTGVLGPSHFAAIGGDVFTPCSAGDQIAVIDGEQFRLETRVPVGDQPHDIATDSQFAYVGCRGAGEVTVISAADRSVAGRVSVGGRVQGVVVDGPTQTGYAVDQAGKRVVRFTTGHDPRVIAEASLDGTPYEVSLRLDRDSVYVPARDAGIVHEFDQDLQHRTVHRGFVTPTEVHRLADREWVIDRDASCLRALDGTQLSTPASALVGRPSEHGVVLSHYDAGMVSLVDPEDGVSWTTQTPDLPFGTVLI